MRVVVCLLAVFFVSAPSEGRAGPFERQQRAYSRVAGAFDAHLEALELTFAEAGAAWPPRGIFLRAFKHEGALELWAEPADSDSGAPRVLVRTFPICQESGVLGPKRREGDLQVPEGFYTIDRFNPRSSYHLSLGIDYPNAVDKARAGGDPPGGDIFIHGNCVTVGCLPIEDQPIEALYVVAVRARDRGQRKIPVHIFPCRFGSEACDAALERVTREETDPELATFWSMLALAHAEFEATRVPPRFVAKKTGYVRQR